MYPLQVSSVVELTKEVGAYTLEVAFSSFPAANTTCIYWDATAEQVETALEALANVDSVHVERYGSGSEEDK